MRRAILHDLRTIVNVVGDAFTRERGGESNARDRRARLVITWFGELTAVLAREAYVGSSGDVVVHVGRRGGWHTVRVHAIGAAVLLVGVLLPAALVGAIAAALGGVLVGCLIAGVTVLAVYVLVIAGAIAASKQQRRSGGPTEREKSYRKGLPRPYWLITTLAAADGMTPAAVPAVRSWLPTAVPVGATLVAVAGEADRRRLYVALGFRPLAGSYWVLVRVNLPDQSSTIPG